jgi:hypothetical protein
MIGQRHSGVDEIWWGSVMDVSGWGAAAKAKISHRETEIIVVGGGVGRQLKSVR